MKKKPELVSPAGDWSGLVSAVDAGADGVYFGAKGLTMRNTARNFDLLEIKKVMDFLRSRGKKGYLSLNVLVYNSEIGRVERILDAARAAGVDAVILWDMAVLKLARERGLEAHLSTQASVANMESLRFFSSHGVRRVILARECSLDDITDIIRKAGQEGIDCEVEAFVHGAMCVSVSGRCFLSHHSFGKSANRGECLQPCRREFAISDPDDGISYVVGEDYVLSPKDLCTVGIIDRLTASGIDAFKIEGRLRSPEYVSVTTSVYREAIDACNAGLLDDRMKAELYARLRKVYNRGFSEGFYLGAPEEWVSGRLENEYEKVFVGEVVNYYARIGVAEVLVRKENLEKGQRVLISGSTTPACFADVDEMEIDHKAVDKAGRGQRVAVKVPFRVRANDKVYLWRRRGPF